ncbi:MAG: pilus assembly protein PilM [Nitrospiraceae bacterium]
MIESVGLDIGTTAFKAVRLRRSLTGQEEVDYFYRALPFLREEPIDHSTLARHLRSFLEQHRLHRSSIVTAVPARELSLRRVALPFHDQAKMAQVLPYEIESLIPMDLEDVAVEGVNVSAPDRVRTANQAHDVLVAAAPKKMVGSHLAFLADARVHPVAVNVDALALFSIAQYLRHEGTGGPENVAILDIGATNTTLCLIHQGRPWVLRTLSWGGTALTRALAHRYSWSVEEAERRKRVASVQLGEEWIEPLLREVRLALHSYEASTETPLEHCWITGGGSKLRQFPEYLAHRLGLTLVGPREGFGANSPQAFAVAYGLALHPKLTGRRWLGPARPAALGYDLKHQLQASQQAGTQPSRRQWAMAAVAAGVLLSVGVADVWTRATLKESRVKQDKAALNTFAQRIVGGTVPPGEEVEYVRAQIQSIGKRLDVLEDQRTAVLPTLSLLVKQLPPNVTIKVRNLLMEGTAVQIEAETDSFESVERIKRALAGEQRFQDIVVGDARVGVNANQVIFRLTFTSMAI